MTKEDYILQKERIKIYNNLEDKLNELTDAILKFKYIDNLTLPHEISGFRLYVKPLTGDSIISDINFGYLGLTDKDFAKFLIPLLESKKDSLQDQLDKL